MKNQVEKYYGAILEDGRRCVSKMPNGKAIAFAPMTNDTFITASENIKKIILLLANL